MTKIKATIAFVTFVIVTLLMWGTLILLVSLIMQIAYKEMLKESVELVILFIISGVVGFVCADEIHEALKAKEDKEIDDTFGTQGMNY